MVNDTASMHQEFSRSILGLDKGKTIHLAFQIGRLLAYAEDRRTELKAQIQPALAVLQATLRLPAMEAQAEPLDTPLLHSHTLASGSSPDELQR
jgi:hypothetical protein